MKTKTLNSEKIAQAHLRDLSVSTKFSVELCRHIRYKNLQKAKTMVQNINEMRSPLPLLVHNKTQAHRKGNFAAGRFPQKATAAFSVLLNSVEANARAQGLNTDSLKIIHIKANKASTPFRAGRHRGRVMKRTHVDIIVEEKEPKKTEKKIKNKQELKKETKPKQPETAETKEEKQ